MVFKTRVQAVASLREFAPWLRDAHQIVKFWSTTDKCFKYTRVLQGK
jgi:hypothetical protein